MKTSILIIALAVISWMTASLILSKELSQSTLPHYQISTLVDEVSAILNENYVYPETATEMEVFLKKQMLAGKYQNSSTQKELIKRIESDLRDVSKDGHIALVLAENSVDRSLVVLPKTQSQKVILTEIIQADNNNKKIGYIRINSFGGDSETKDLLTEAMENIAISDALIIDLRENRGGDPNLVALLSSYFLESDTQLWSILDRNGDQVLELRTKNNQTKFVGDLCILTSRKTYSAAESFAYTLKHLGRATIIGEATGGGAHLVEMMRVNDSIDIRIPVARAYNHKTESNWEGVGVIPSILVESNDAKRAAIKFLNDKY